MIKNAVPDSAVETAANLLAAEIAPRDHYRLGVELSGIAPDLLTPGPTGGELGEGDRATFQIANVTSSGYHDTPARLRYLSEHAAWWSSVTARADDEEIEAAAQRFEADVFPVHQLIFGAEWSPGIDGDRQIHILLVEEPTWGGYFGYFSHINEYPAALQPHSNQREMFILNLGGAALDSAAFAGELAHEYQHLIHWYKDRNEDRWLDEAMGELATFLVGAPEASSAVGLTNAEVFSLNPFIQLTARPERRFGDEDQSVFAHYAAERLFAVYLLEQFGPQFVKDMVNDPLNGIASIQAGLDRLPNRPRFEDVYASWLLANLLNQPGLAQGQYGYREIAPVLPDRQVVNSFRGEPLVDQLPPYGARYYEIRADQDVHVSFRGSTLARLTPADPPSGQYAWYSNRGDESQFTLTRTFDLTGLTSATLNYRVWFELDGWWDYGYVEVSTDGGEHWTILPTAHGTDQNPNEQAYGWGYTGASESWLSESLDLTPYAGQVILLRFEVLTDLTSSRDGLMLDDIAIPELAYSDGAEDGSGGWEAQGFIRSSNFVPANWILWVLKLSTPTQIEWIPLSPEQTAEIEIAGFGESFPFAALVVSVTAPATTLTMDYELVFRPP